MANEEEMAAAYKQEHTLEKPTDPQEAHAPKSYKATGDEVAIDPSKAVLIQGMRSCLVFNEDGEPGIAFQVLGRINQSKQQVAILHVATIQTLARMIGQLIELGVSISEEKAKEFHEALGTEMQRQLANSERYKKGAHGDDEA